MKNYLIIFSYKGTNFYGSQKQPGLNTVQNLFEDTLSRIYDEKIKFCSETSYLQKHAKQFALRFLGRKNKFW